MIRTRVWHRVRRGAREEWLPYCPAPRVVASPVDYNRRAAALGGTARRCLRCGAALVGSPARSRRSA